MKTVSWAWARGDHGVIGWVYEADTHCDHCALERFGGRALADGVKDSEGNEVLPIFDWDEWGPDGVFCGDCGDCIVEPFKLKLELAPFEVDRLVNALAKDPYMKSIVERLVALQEEAYGSD